VRQVHPVPQPLNDGWVGCTPDQIAPSRRPISWSRSHYPPSPRSPRSWQASAPASTPGAGAWAASRRSPRWRGRRRWSPPSSSPPTCGCGARCSCLEACRSGGGLAALVLMATVRYGMAYLPGGASRRRPRPPEPAHHAPNASDAGVARHRRPSPRSPPTQGRCITRPVKRADGAM